MLCGVLWHWSSPSSALFGTKRSKDSCQCLITDCPNKDSPEETKEGKVGGPENQENQDDRKRENQCCRLRRYRHNRSQWTTLSFARHATKERRRAESRTTVSAVQFASDSSTVWSVSDTEHLVREEEEEEELDTEKGTVEMMAKFLCPCCAVSAISTSISTTVHHSSFHLLK